MIRSFSGWFGRNFLTKSLRVQIAWLLFLYIASCCVFWVILHVWGGNPPQVKNWFWWIHLHIIDTGGVWETARNGVNSNVVSICGIIMHLLNIFIFSAIFFSVFINFFEESAYNVRNGYIRYEIEKFHYVILGWDNTGASLVNSLIEYKIPIVILSLAKSEDIKKQIVSFDKNKEIDKKLLYILNGSFTNSCELVDKTLNLPKAKRIYVLGEKNYPTRDCDVTYVANNNTAVENKCQNLGVKVFANIHNLITFNKLKNIEYENRNNIDVTFFNFYENWARRIWSYIPTISDKEDYLPLAYKPVTENAFVHLIIVGFGQMGQALAIEAAKAAHYGKGKNSLITIITNNMQKQSSFVSGFCLKKINGDRYSWQENNGYKADVEFEFINKYAESEEIKDYLVHVAEETKNGKEIPTLAICVSNADDALKIAYSLPVEFTAGNNIPVLVRCENDHLDIQIVKKAKGSWGNIKFFGNLRECVGINENTETFAKLLNAIYALFEGNFPSVVPEEVWKNTSEYNRWSSRQQALSFIERLRYGSNTLVAADVKPPKETTQKLSKSEVEKALTNCTSAYKCNLEDASKAEHNRWSVNQWLNGWSFAETRDNSLYKHNYLVAFEKLDDETKEKDIRPFLLAEWILQNYCAVKITKQS